MGPESLPSPRDVLRLLYTYPLRWLVPTAIIVVLAAGYAIFGPKQYEATQALIVRNEATGATDAINTDRGADMKLTQDTILELLKSQSVISSTLVCVGPDDRHPNPEVFPTTDDIEVLRKNIRLAAPNGAEFGKTEVFYLKVRDAKRSRAIQLAETLCTQLQQRFQQLRDQKAQSMILELGKAVTVAESDLAEASARLNALESEVGSDLAELRALHGSPSNESELRSRVIEAEKELRAAEVQLNTSQELLVLLQNAEKDPGHLLATPNRLLESQPALRRLKDGLVDAQLQTSKLLGQMSAEHPQVRSALRAEEEISTHIHEEVAVAIRGVEVDIRMFTKTVEDLKTQLANTQHRLERLAKLRTEYSNLVDEVDSRSQALVTAQRELAETRATQASAHTVRLISSLDEPECGDYPINTRKAVVLLAGLVGGLATGFGVLFLTVPSITPTAPAATAPVVERTFVRRGKTHQEADLVAPSGVAFSEELTVGSASSRL